MEGSSLFDQYQMSNTCDLQAFEDQFNLQSFSAESYSYCSNPSVKKALNLDGSISIEMPLTSSSSQIISFDKTQCAAAALDSRILEPKTEISCYGNMALSSVVPRQYERNYKRGVSRNSLHAQDHVIAERKRREKLNQRFIALSAILPGLKKTDKASVLGDAIKYIKQVEEQVRVLEQKAKERSIESAVLIRKSHLSDCNPDMSSDEKERSFSDKQLPEIEVRISDKNVLIRIHCQKHDGLFTKLVGEVEKLNLTIVNGNVFPFGNSTQYMTFMTQTDAEFSRKANDLVRKLEEALLKFISHA